LLIDNSSKNSRIYKTFKFFTMQKPIDTLLSPLFGDAKNPYFYVNKNNLYYMRVGDRKEKILYLPDSFWDKYDDVEIAIDRLLQIVKRMKEEDRYVMIVTEWKYLNLLYGIFTKGKTFQSDEDFFSENGSNLKIPIPLQKSDIGEYSEITVGDAYGMWNVENDMSQIYGRDNVRQYDPYENGNKEMLSKHLTQNNKQ